ncbi:redoxin domain-containing protein [Arcobacter vandammei]|uniref:redoxin domain-containing protein n=1 Tax=Arcobacter vandammei TaxID=2782243 RepID=UPI0018DFFA0E|nr:redoxin domain-containing protein [Arcobacter vandammei]
MSEKIKKFLKNLIKYTILFIIVLNIVSYFKALDLNKEKLDIKTFTLLDGSTYEVKDDKPLIVHFWASWCPICAIEEQSIDKISKDYEVITISTQSGNNIEIKQYLKKNNLSFRVVNDEDGELSKKFNIKAFPTTLIYDKNQNLKFSEVGYTSLFGLYFRAWWSK